MTPFEHDTIRLARREEAQALSELALRSKAVWGYGAEFLERCRPLLTLTPEYIDQHLVFAAEARGQVAGFYALLAGGDVEIRLDLLFVAPALVRRGIGARLLEHALEQARHAGYARMVVESDPWAEGFYVRAGAVRVGEVPSAAEEGRSLPVLVFRLGEERRALGAEGYPR